MYIYVTRRSILVNIDLSTDFILSVGVYKLQTISHRTEIKTGVTPYLRLTTQVFGNTGSEVSRKCYGRFAFYFDFLPFLCRCGEFRFVFELKIPMITSSNQCYDTYCRVDTEKSRNKRVSCYTII